LISSHLLYDETGTIKHCSATFEGHGVASYEPEVLGLIRLLKQFYRLLDTHSHFVVVTDCLSALQMLTAVNKRLNSRGLSHLELIMRGRYKKRPGIFVWIATSSLASSQQRGWIARSGAQSVNYRPKLMSRELWEASPALTRSSNI
jgi:hypothetical protein